MDNMVMEVRLYKNGIVYNTNHERNYLTKKYMEIEFFDDKLLKLDLDAGSDITQSDYLIVIHKGKLVKTLFKNELS